MRIGLGFLAAFVSLVWVLLEGFCAWRNGMLTAKQMARKYPKYPKGLPIVWHGGMWGDLFIISSIIGFAVAWYSAQWSGGQLAFMLIIGMALSAVMHMIYIKTPFPDSLAWREELSIAGYLHFLYMGIVFAILGLLFFYTTALSPTFLIIVSVLLALHVAIGNHLLLGWANESHFHFKWCPDFIHKPDPWITIGAACAGISFLAWNALR